MYCNVCKMYVCTYICMYVCNVTEGDVVEACVFSHYFFLDFKTFMFKSTSSRKLSTRRLGIVGSRKKCRLYISSSRVDM